MSFVLKMRLYFMQHVGTCRISTPKYNRLKVKNSQLIFLLVSVPIYSFRVFYQVLYQRVPNGIITYYINIKKKKKTTYAYFL